MFCKMPVISERDGEERGEEGPDLDPQSEEHQGGVGLPPEVDLIYGQAEDADRAAANARLQTELETIETIF